jgi:hypothetical protein
MFVRFKRVKLSNKSGYSDFSLHAVLVENRRDERGRPRQHIISYLGSIRERRMYEPERRIEFLKSIQNKLRQLSLTPKDMSRIQMNLINNMTHKFHISRV